MQARITLDPDPQSVGRARRFCSATLTGWGAHSELVSTCALLVSELATNAILHAGTPFTVTMDRTGELGSHLEGRGDPTRPASRREGSALPGCESDHPSAHLLRVEVGDGDPRMPQIRNYGRQAMSGRGLHLVEALACSSGAIAAGSGKTVWFELAWTAPAVP